MVILKGPELARRYPDGLCARQATSTCSSTTRRRRTPALRAAGFVVTGDPRRYVRIHHLQPLVWPTLSVRVELHRAPKWIDGLNPPSTAELFALARPRPGGRRRIPDAHAGGARRRWPSMPGRTSRCGARATSSTSPSSRPKQTSPRSTRSRVAGVWPTSGGRRTPRWKHCLRTAVRRCRCACGHDISSPRGSAPSPSRISRGG